MKLMRMMNLGNGNDIIKLNRLEYNKFHPSLILKLTGELW